MNKSKFGIFLAVLAATLYSINAPLSKIMLTYMPPTVMAGFLYVGAGAGMSVIALLRKMKNTERKESKLTISEFPYTLAMVLLDVAAPIFLLFGLRLTTAATASLINNFEIVATALVALIAFKERISARLWSGIIFVTVACFILSFEDILDFEFSLGSLFIVLACVCWGFENNCTRKISSKDPLQIVLIKGLFSGLTSVIIGLSIGEKITSVWSVFAVIGIGLVAYGLSIYFYVYAQRFLGAARTSAYYAISPFIGSILSLFIFAEMPSYTYLIALSVMCVGAWLCAKDEPVFKKLSSKRKSAHDKKERNE